MSSLPRRAVRAARRNGPALVLVTVFVVTPSYFAFSGPGTAALVARQ